ncbi:hypothetical protein AWB80_04079 [Caballeronia pedi]|uniref:Phosphoadenosine phosphosulphate reductase domain-containing protein n=1 Tax=Caballeronia pedi TaxID=1777141 RepID=A0A158BT67_9BURK|nr:hypothetical protein [Caballeronia pedi]SAK73298.1 hypothetical protein AWB80_04079 [Caballeronia pedi]
MEQQIFSKMEAAISVMQRYIEQGYSLSCGYSGGKDSTCTLVLMLEAIGRANRSTIGHHIQSADTTIETRISFSRGDLPGKYHRKWTLLVGTCKHRCLPVAETCQRPLLNASGIVEHDGTRGVHTLADLMLDGSSERIQTALRISSTTQYDHFAP